MENIIIHIFTVGFHHKRGCEIEFIFPPLKDENLKIEQLEIWKNLPSLALPDGAHKTHSDTINFILPGISNSKQQIVFGVSCFKQVSAECLKTKSEDVTRNTIQKSIVVLATLPLFGAISSLLRGITENYFEIGNFEEREILVESYHQLNQHFKLILEDNEKKCNGLTNIMHQELSITNLIGQYEHGILTLIKILLLRKKVLFFMEPVDKLTTTILSLASLFPGILETKSFQHSFELVGDSITKSSSIRKHRTAVTNDSHVQDISHQNIDGSDNNDPKAPIGISLLQNLKSSRGQNIKIHNNLTTSGANAMLSGSRPLRIPESDQHKSIASEDMTIPLPPFCATNNGTPTCDLSKTDWGFPLDIFDQRNVLLPYANIGLLSILDHEDINSFIIGANNHLWKMKFSKYDLLINEDLKSGGIQLCQTNNQNKHDDFHLGKLLQLTVLDRRFVDYLLQVVKFHYKTTSSPVIMKTGMVQSRSDSNLMAETGEDPAVEKMQDAINLHKFSDSKALEEWLREVLLDYIKGILLNAAALGTKSSFEDFGWIFLQTVQQQSYFENWYYSIDKSTIISESTSNLRIPLASESSSQLNSLTAAESSETENSGKSHSIMNYDHPGRLVQAKIGDNIPGYYQLREYADHSKAIVNKSVNEIKRFSSERGGQLKSSMTAGLTKLSDMAKVRGIKFGSIWWQPSGKADDKIDNVTEALEEH